uniref:Uncharacterized protein n=1 Tax=Tanacetum cinerariifolium TaxID=118510 RepID=A0A6L2MZ98_TANCI|nr:hypothetical protein [Tanacetum cinerariifolium]
MILESVENGPLIWSTIEENGVTRTKKYAELSAAEKIQVDCDLKATNIILQGLVVPVFSPKDDLIACLNKAMDFLTPVASSRLRILILMILTVMISRMQKRFSWPIYPNYGSDIIFETKDLDTYDSDCDDISNAKVVLMANISKLWF